MGLLITEINELRALLQDFKDKRISTEDLNAQLHIYNQTERRARLILTAWALGIKTGGKGFDFDKAISEQLVGREKIKSPKALSDRTAKRGR